MSVLNQITTLKLLKRQKQRKIFSNFSCQMSDLCRCDSLTVFPASKHETVRLRFLPYHCWANAGSMLDRRRRRRDNIKPTFDWVDPKVKRLMFAGTAWENSGLSDSDLLTSL